MIYFTSDHHFHHNSINGYSNRGFHDVEDMNRGLIEAWNSVVGKHDIVYHLGDFCWGPSKKRVKELLAELNGRVFLIRGNHDKQIKNSWVGEGLFEWVGDLKDLKIGDVHVTLCHYQMATWNKAHYGAYMFHGHSHQGHISTNAKRNIFHVGVDSSPGFKPLTLEQIILHG